MDTVGKRPNNISGGITMNNDFFAFTETYADDIKAFFEALKAFFEALIAKFTADEETETE